MVLVLTTPYKVIPVAGDTTPFDTTGLLYGYPSDRPLLPDYTSLHEFISSADLVFRILSIGVTTKEGIVSNTFSRFTIINSAVVGFFNSVLANYTLPYFPTELSIGDDFDKGSFSSERKLSVSFSGEVDTAGLSGDVELSAFVKIEIDERSFDWGDKL